MQADTPPFLPSSHPPTIYQPAEPSHGARQLDIQSHGYSYLVTGNTLLASSRIRTILLHASTSQEAVGAVSMAYRTSGYFVVAVKASVENKNIHIMVVQGQISKKDIASGLGWFYSGLQGEDLTESTIIRRNILAESYSARNGQQLGVNFTPSQNPDGTDLNAQQTPRPSYRMLVKGSYFAFCQALFELSIFFVGKNLPKTARWLQEISAHDGGQWRMIFSHLGRCVVQRAKVFFQQIHFQPELQKQGSINQNLATATTNPA